MIDGVKHQSIMDYYTSNKCIESEGKQTTSVEKSVDSIIDCEKNKEETSIQIGASSMTKKEWDRLMKKVDYTIKEMKEQIKREEERKLKKKDEDQLKEKDRQKKMLEEKKLEEKWFA